jgi:hypothetical protein
VTKSSDHLDKDNVKIYLDYLDKEMTIMGILSTFSIVTLGFLAGKIVFTDAQPGKYNFWENSFLFCFLGFLGLAVAALAFYLQRSLLAWFYGQISLNMAKSDFESVLENLNDADGWGTWIRYQIGFGALTLAFSEFGFLMLVNKINYLQLHTASAALGVLGIVFVIFSIKVVSVSKFRKKEK